MRIHKRSDDFFMTELDGEAVLMHVDTGNFHALSGTGLAIWRLMDETDDLDQLVGLLCERFDVGETECRADVDAFINRLAQAGLIVRG